MKAVIAALAVVSMTAGAHADDFSGLWRGAYDCDGITREIRIELVGAGGHALSGMVSFRSDSVAGSYAVRAATSPDGRTLLIEPSGWIDRPAGFAMVGMRGRLDRETIFGTMSSTQCGGFYAVKASEPSAVEPLP